MQNILDRLKASVKVKRVTIPEVEGDIYLRAFSVQDSLDYLAHMDKNPNESPYATMIALSLCDEQGEKAVGLDKIDEIKGLDAKIVDALADAFATIHTVEVQEKEENPFQLDPNSDKPLS